MIPMATLSQMWVCGRWIAGIAGSNSGGDMNAWGLWVLLVVK
jgi:hypothetical protein